ncbi:MAG TPA: MOSC domain-containing protein [Solirubrobacterales bacterium]|nr:MOSC domain-containing protein [Solirubrobacterales bacterium]
MTDPAHVLSVNVGGVRTIDVGDRTITTGIWKQPVAGRVAVRGVNVHGDDQADRTVHGGYDKAVYAYAREDTDWWEAELGRALQHGNFGENLTTAGIDLTACVIGERWHAGSTVLEVSEPRFPCFKLGIRMGDPGFLKRFAAARRPGTYLRIVEEGELGAGDPILVRDRPDHGVTIALFAEAYLGDHALADKLLEAPVSDSWREWAERQVERVAGQR